MFLPFGCWAVRLKHLRLACPLFGLMAWEGIAAYLPVLGRYGGCGGIVGLRLLEGDERKIWWLA